MEALIEVEAHHSGDRNRSLFRAPPRRWEALLASSDSAQPAVTSVQIAMVAALRHLGFTPDAVIGLSMGELAAATTVNALTVQEGLKVAAAQARAIRGPLPPGRMAMVGLPVHEAQELTRGRGAVWVGVELGPRSTVLSGSPDAVASALRAAGPPALEAAGPGFPFAYHTDQMVPVRDAFLSAVGELMPSLPCLPFASTVIGRLLTTERLTPSYWWQVVAARCRFLGAMTALLSSGIDRLVEVSPAAMLSGVVRDIAVDLGVRLEICSAMTLLEARRPAARAEGPHRNRLRAVPERPQQPSTTTPI
jgi:acyl transferase domain-containing protein